MLVGRMVRTTAELAYAEGLGSRGFRVVFNEGPNAGCPNPHVRLEVLGGRQVSWPPP